MCTRIGVGGDGGSGDFSSVSLLEGEHYGNITFWGVSTL